MYLVGAMSTCGFGGYGARVAIFAAIPLLVTPSSARAADRCDSARSRTIVANDAARVFVKSATRRVYVCTLSDGRKRLIRPKPQRDLDNENVGRFRLLGKFVAYERVFSSFRTGPTYEIVVRRVDSDRGSRTLLAAPGAQDTPVRKPDDGVRDLVVTRHGAVAWIVRNPYAGGQLEVRKFDVAGETLLDSGPTIAETSLLLRGKTVGWRVGDRSRNAALDD